MAYLNARQRQERAHVLRELLLRPALKRRENPTPDYLSAVDDLTEELVITDNGGVLAVSETDMLGRPDDRRHDLIAAARLIMAHLETAPGRAMPKAGLTTALTARGFTPATVSAALSWLSEQKLIAVAGGTITDITGDRRPSAPRSPLPAELLTPRNTTAPIAVPSTTPSNRPRMPVGALIEHPERVDMGARMRAQAESMPTASFEVGDIPAAAASTVKKDEKPAAPVITDSAIVAYMEALTDVFARAGKPTVALSELSVRFPAVELPEGVTEQAALSEAARRMRDNGTLRRDGDAITHVPAEKAVSTLAAWLSDAALPGKTITVAALSARENAQALTPSGWRTETIATLALDAVVASGVMAKVDGGWMKPAPKVVEQKPAPKPVAPAPAPKPEAVEPAPEPAKSGVPSKPDTETPPPAASTSKAVATREDATVAPTTDTATVQVVSAEMLPWLAAIANHTQIMAQAMVTPQASAREALNGEALLHVVLRRVMVLLERHGVLTNGELQRAFNGKLPAQREALEIALKYGVQVGALAATGAKNPKGWGARYTLADPTRVGIARHELLNEAMKTRPRRPVVGGGKQAVCCRDPGERDWK